MKKLSIPVLLLAVFALDAGRLHAQGVVEYGAATSAAGSLGAKLGSALGSALNNVSNQTTQTVIKNAPAASSQNSDFAKKTTPLTPAKTGPSTVRIESTPSGATIFVDGLPKGLTPLTLSLAKGLHDIRVARDGFDPWQKTLLVGAGQSLPLKAILKDPKTSPPRFTVQR